MSTSESQSMKRQATASDSTVPQTTGASSSAPDISTYASRSASTSFAAALSYSQNYPSPLTTIFTPPADCYAASAYLQPANATTINYTATCYPQSWVKQQVSTNHYYSPGVCPWLYEWAAVAKVNPPNGQVETRAWCCPSGMSSTGYHDYTTYCYDGPTLGASGSGRFALPVSVAFRKQDLKWFKPPHAPLTALRNVPSTAFEGSGFRTSYSGGLSTGALTAIAVVLPVVAMIAVVATLLWYFRRRHNRRLAHEKEEGTRIAEAEGSLPKAEKDGNERFEASGKSKPAEAEGKAIAELDGGWQAPEVDGTGTRLAR